MNEFNTLLSHLTSHSEVLWVYTKGMQIAVTEGAYKVTIPRARFPFVLPLPPLQWPSQQY